MITIFSGPNLYRYFQGVYEIKNTLGENPTYNSIYIDKITDENSISDMLSDALTSFVSVNLFSPDTHKLTCITFLEKPNAENLRTTLNSFKDYCTQNFQLVIHFLKDLTEREIKSINKCLDGFNHTIIKIQDCTNLSEAQQFCYSRINTYNLQFNQNELNLIIDCIIQSCTLSELIRVQNKTKKITFYSESLINNVFFKLHRSCTNTILSYNDVMKFLYFTDDCDGIKTIDNLFSAKSLSEALNICSNNFNLFDYGQYIGFIKLFTPKIKSYISYLSTGVVSSKHAYFDKKLFANSLFSINNPIDCLIDCEQLSSKLLFDNESNARLIKFFIIKYFNFK